MSKISIAALLLAAMALSVIASAQQSPLTVTNGVQSAHIFPTIYLKNALPAAGGPLGYHGGPVMQTVNTYAIFWAPTTLQNGNPTSIPAAYQTVQKNMLTDYPGHGIDNNNTQYYQGSSPKKYIQNVGKLAGSFVDTNPYPASGCTDTATPGNCINDTQLIAEIARVMTLKAWKGGLNNMFLVFTSSGEGSCFTSAGTSCAYVQYCAYHSYFTNGAGQTVVYSNEPFGNTSVCQQPGTPSPNSNPQADAAATAASHELTEATTDPMLNAWFDSSGNEIGDLCAYLYGTNTWDAGLANEMWNGHFYELQTEYDNHLGGCVQVGP
jgi:hypothetical protein